MQNSHIPRHFLMGKMDTVGTEVLIGPLIKKNIHGVMMKHTIFQMENINLQISTINPNVWLFFKVFLFILAYQNI